MSRHHSIDHTLDPSAGLPPAPRSWPYIAPRDRPVIPRTAGSGGSLPPWPRRPPEPPAANTRAQRALRGDAGIPGHTARTRHGLAPRFARRPWCTDSHRTTSTDRLVDTPTSSVADTAGNEPEPRACEAGSSAAQRSRDSWFLPVPAGAHHRNISATASARARSEATASGANRPVRNAGRAAAETGTGTTVQVAGPGISEPVAAGTGDIERRARRYERRIAHGASRPTEHDRVPVPAGAVGSQRANPGRRSPALPPGGTQPLVDIPSRLAPGRRFRRSPVRNPIRRGVPEDHIGARSRSGRYPSAAGSGDVTRPCELRGLGYRWSSSATALTPKGRGRTDAPAVRHLRLRSDGRHPETRVMAVGSRQVTTRSVSVRARHRRSVVGRRRWDVLLGAAFTTVLIAFPLGPGATAAAYSGESSVLAQSHTGNTADGNGRTRAPHANAPLPDTSADRARPATAAITAPAADGTHHLLVGMPARKSPVSPGEAAPRSADVAAAPALGRTGHRPNPAATSGVGPATPASVAVCGGSGSASGSGSRSESAPWSGSAELGAGSASGSACTVVPALGELLRTLIRLAPKIAPPPCPCPNGRT